MSRMVSQHCARAGPRARAACGARARGNLHRARAVADSALSGSSSGLAGMKTVSVQLDTRTYPIYIGPDLLNQPQLLTQHIRGKRALVVTNETIAPLYLDRTVTALEGSMAVDTVVLRDGEEFKSLEELEKIWDRALEVKLDRGATFVALGGGVVGDMVGFAAACYQRGVDFVQIPTTVMAQVDSSVGGKTGVNHPLGKNMLGSFHQPRVVLIDIDTLLTLPDRHVAAGIAEIVKYGLIRDAPLFEWLEGSVERLLARDTAAMTYAIERSCVNKAEVVAEDEREGGVRATLNLGHTFGHAIENASGYGTYLHGEAVAIGMAMAADLSVRLGWIDRDILQRLQSLLERCKLPMRPAGMTPTDFMNIMALDKKVQDGRIRLILLKGPLGSCVVTGDFDPEALQETLQEFC